MIKTDANLFRIISRAISTEETRYYLRGVFVQPRAEGGVTLVATNGHVMLAAHDPHGEADESAIIGLGDNLKHCKAPKGRGEKAGQTFIELATGEADADIWNKLGDSKDPVAKAYRVRIDGTFPDWRHVTPGDVSETGQVPALAGVYVKLVAETAIDLTAHYADGAGAMRILPSTVNGTGSPALIRFAASENVFGVIMPVRAVCPAGLPAWY